MTIYINKSEYLELRDWSKTVSNELFDYLYLDSEYCADWLSMPKVEFLKLEWQSLVDVWLVANCPLEWLRAELMDDYGEDCTKEEFMEFAIESANEAQSEYEIMQTSQSATKPYYRPLPDFYIKWVASGYPFLFGYEPIKWMKSRHYVTDKLAFWREQLIGTISKSRIAF